VRILYIYITAFLIVVTYDYLIVVTIKYTSRVLRIINDDRIPMAKYKALKSDSIGTKYKGKKPVDNIRTYPKKRKK